MALRVHGLARRRPHRDSFLVLAPTDEAFERVGLSACLARKLWPSIGREELGTHAPDSEDQLSERRSRNRMPTALIDLDRRLVKPEIEAEAGADLVQKFRPDAIAP